MKNKKIIFLVATVCCLVVCWLCFGAWSIGDTSYQVSDFNYSKSIVYLYIVPSSNIPSSEYSNVLIYGNFKRASTSSDMYSLHTGPFSSMTSSELGFRYSSSSSLIADVPVQFYVNVSSYDTSIGNYVITNSYYITRSSTFGTTWRQSNYITDDFIASDFRTIIVFIDKVSSGGVSQEEYDALQSQYNSLNSDFRQLQSNYQKLMQDKLELQSDYNALQSSYDQVSEQLAQAEQNYSTLQQDYTQLQTDFNILEIYTNEIRGSLAEARTENAELEREVARLNDVIESMGSGGTALDFIGTAFEKVGDILAIEILPNGITIGTIVAIPLILGVVFLVLRLVRGE